MPIFPTPGGSDVWGAQLNGAIRGLLTPAAPDHDFVSTHPFSFAGSYVSGDMSVHDGFLDVTTGRAAGSYLYVAAPGGDFTATMRAIVATPSGGGMFGLLATDTSGNGVAGGWYNSAPDGPIVAGVTGGVYNSTYAAVSGARGTLIDQGVPCWYRLRKSGTTYYLSLSVNGEAWGPEANLGGGPSSPARIGIGAFYATVPSFLVDFFDVV